MTAADRNSEENSISAIDWSVQVTGPKLVMNGNSDPIILGEYCKFSGETIALAPTSQSQLNSDNSSRAVHFSLFHPISQSDPRVLHSIKLVLVAIKLDVFPYIAKWAKFVQNSIRDFSHLSSILTLPPSNRVRTSQPPLPSKLCSVVSHEFNCNLKLIDLKISLFTSDSDNLALCHLFVHETAVQFNQSEIPEFRQRCQLTVAGLVGSLPREVSNPQLLSPHSAELMKIPGRFAEISSVGVSLSESSPEISLFGDGA